jgi:hypothetical protein
MPRKQLLAVLNITVKKGSGIKKGQKQKKKSSAVEILIPIVLISIN